MAPGTAEQILKPPKKERTKKEKNARRNRKSRINSMVILKCPLCLDNIQKKAVVSTKCGHVFCRKCLQKSLVSNPTCPMCRKKISGPSGYLKLFLTANFDDRDDDKNMF